MIKEKEVHTNTQIEETPRRGKLRLWLKRFGVGAFLFFLIKGLIWLAVFFGLWELIF